ncbi:MAG TPA: type II toxin-antitoxin system RelE/ParE family toxin [Candidatus Paceibacterota bacterium]|nr:type II toxin-antitoxin system RelE/ParE family toxin [Candidatus Paceibacterota bacterium]
MKIAIVLEAETELRESIEYYELINPGLGIRFKEEVRQAVAWIHEHFLLPRVRSKGYRRVNLKVFPHYIAYLADEDTIWILAVAHSRRRPEFWMERKQRLPSNGKS